MLKSISRIAPIVFLCLPLTACMGLSPYSPTRNMLNAQVGHNIKEMLPKWPMPNGATAQSYKVSEQQTAYVYVYGYHPAHHETQGYSTMVGPGIVQNGSYDKYVPEYTDCVLTFFADQNGTILRYDMKTNGAINQNSCGIYTSGYRF